MKRREALKNLGLSLGTITITPTVLGLLQSCQDDLGWNPVFFNKKCKPLFLAASRSDFEMSSLE